MQFQTSGWSFFHMGWYDKLVLVVSVPWLVGALIILLQRRKLPCSDTTITLALMPALLGLANAWLALRHLGLSIRLLDPVTVLPLAPEMVLLFSRLLFPTGAALAIATIGLALPGRDQKPTAWVTRLLIVGAFALSAGLVAAVFLLDRSGFAASIPLFGTASAIGACLSAASAAGYWFLRFSGRRSRLLEAFVVVFLASLVASVLATRSYFLAQLA